MAKYSQISFLRLEDRFVAVLVRKVSGLHIKKIRNGLEMGEQMDENWW